MTFSRLAPRSLAQLRLYTTAAPAPKPLSLRQKSKSPADPAALEALTSAGWTITSSPSPSAPTEQKLQRSFRFKDFSQAWGFMSRVALAAERANVSRVVGVGGRGES